MSIQSLNSISDKKHNRNLPKAKQNNVAFKGMNPIVGTMDFIEKGGYAASFIIQDGLGFVAPRVGKGILRGSKQVDENGNPVLDENGKQKREYNWEFARKEGVREIITGPSAFLIPLGMLAVINKYFGRGNNVKLDYIDSFKNSFVDFAKTNFDDIKAGKANKLDFYKNVFSDVINKSINVSGEQNITGAEIDAKAAEFAEKHIKIEAIKADKSLNKKARNAKIAELGGTVEDDFMKLMKQKIGGAVSEQAIRMTSSDGKLKNGSIGELLNAMGDYFDDAVKNTKKALSDKSSLADIAEVVQNFTNRRMGSRVLTNLGIFAAVATFYTQIPKLYNMGLKGNPALKGTAAEKAVTADNNDKNAQQAKTSKASDAVETVETQKDKGKEVPFTGLHGAFETAGKKVFNSKSAKSFSDIFELNGPVISGTAMSVLLYGFCIPPRLEHAQDKYEYGEVVVRDFTAFTALLFGAKALARLFSDGFTKLTGLALNKKNMDGRNIWQKTLDYLNPSDTRHSVLTSKQLNSKYMNIDEYKGGVDGFVDFIEKSGGDLKKALKHDKKIQAATEEILKAYEGKSYADATSSEIKQALRKANSEGSELIKKFYKLFDANNGLLKHAKTYNSTFGFLSTILLVPGLIIWLTDVCEKMTARRTAKDFAKMQNQNAVTPEPKTSESKVTEINTLRADKISMAGFMKK